MKKCKILRFTLTGIDATYEKTTYSSRDVESVYLLTGMEDLLNRYLAAGYEIKHVVSTGSVYTVFLEENA